ncbi:M16 family metallopeptidase [Aurantiacibacter spongiae]|uniref:Insulinase family protein n=1 Tax=Aurantiacibacter spongiae TaxID=2488860 RepID=A0A3N5CTZ0_9SPHN|nr:insulinase family protein [Aurantiacibacter spongiae]RPF70880.1 insulinase family protein [Aurantiacibacter spongiae]
MQLRRILALSTALALPFACPAPLFAQSATREAAGAPDTAIPGEIADTFPAIAESDLPFDTEYRVGRLENGMRYVIRSNATPPEQGQVRLWVDFGSAAEAEAEQGFAHFIEHMAFNGSDNLPEGEMVRLLEREGLAFGADTNASTGFDTTLYKLDLPRNDPDLLDTALMLMRETASNLAFDDEAVEREKGVVLSERRVRDTYAMRSLVDNLDFLYPGTLAATRLPIGTVATLQAADGAALRDLYERYYRPENVAVIVSGDYDADAVEDAIRERFADWRGGPRLGSPTFGPADPDLAGETRIFVDPAMAEELTISRHGEWLGQADTMAERRTSLLRAIGYAIVNRRLQRLSRRDDPPFRAAGLGTSDFYREGRTTNLVVRAADGEWERALAAAQEEYRRLLEYGVTEGEIAEQVANIRTALEAGVAGAATRSNGAFVNGAIRLLRNDIVPTTPATSLALFERMADAITPARVMAALEAELVPLDDPLIRFEGRTAPDGGESALRSAWNAGMAGTVAAGDAGEVADFAYADWGEPGTVVSDTLDERLGIRKVRFANGVMLNLKPTDLDEDSVSVAVNVDGGSMLDTREHPLATALFSSLESGGLGEHTRDELQSVLAGRRAGLNMIRGTDTFGMSATTTPRDLELQLQLMSAAIADAGFRPTGEAQYQRGIDNWFARRFATPSASYSSQIGGIVSDGDPRFTIQPREAYAGLTFAQLRDDVIERWSNGAMEVAIVGDIDADETVRMVAATLGTLPQRETAFRPYDEQRQRGFTASRQPRTLYHDGAQDQALVTMTWPSRDDSDERASLVLELLQRVARLELTDTLREDLGQTYSPSVSASQSHFYTGYGTFRTSAAVDAGEVEATRAAMLATLASLRDAPVDEDTLLRARRPMLESYDNALDTNRGWMGLAARAQSESERIDRFLAAKAILQSLTAADVQAAARRYLAPEDRLEVVVLPSPAQAEAQ